MDIICHGVPSRKLYRAYLDWLGRKYRGRVVDYHFRSKERNDWSLTYAAIVEKKNGSRKRIEKIASVDPYYDEFLKGSIYRESCYQCPYSCIERPGDVTLGDFWGIETAKPDMYHAAGVSAVLVNNAKGERLFAMIADRMRFSEVPVEQIAERNGNLRHATPRPAERDRIYHDVLQKGFSCLPKQYRNRRRFYKESVRNLFSNRFRQRIKKLIRHKH